MDQTESHLEQGETPENHQNMESLLAAEGLGNIESPVQGETRKGTIASIGASQILVSIGTKSEGVITGKEFEAIPPEVLAKMTVGEEIDVYVLNPEDQSGDVVLSYIRCPRRSQLEGSRRKTGLRSQLRFRDHWL